MKTTHDLINAHRLVSIAKINNVTAEGHLTLFRLAVKQIPGRITIERQHGIPTLHINGVPVQATPYRHALELIDDLLTDNVEWPDCLVGVVVKEA